ncbi:MAG: sulfotransferase [bacterium]|nr:sulfotransferase [bacterium]
MSDRLEPSSFSDPVIAGLIEASRRREPTLGAALDAPVVRLDGEEALCFADGSEPIATLATDRDDASFAVRALLAFPRGCAGIADTGAPRGSTHLLVNVLAPFFAREHSWEHEVELVVDGHVVDSRIFSKWYVQHQFFVPLAEIVADTRIELRARPTRLGELRDESASFAVRLFVGSKSAIFDRLERDSIWLFSSARAGSTWLGTDILCSNDRARPVDESGIGRMFAPLRWDPERFFELDRRAAEYVESGFAFETGARVRRSAVLPPFERSFANMTLENQILSRRTERVFYRMLRETTLEHVVAEWGVRDYERIVFKCPNDAHGADHIMRAFPRSRMIFLMRDGRDVMRSRFSSFGSEELAETAHRGLRKYAIAFYSHWWNFQNDIIAAAYDAHDPALRAFVRYEDLRAEPHRVVDELLRQLALPETQERIAELVEATALERFGDRGESRPRQQGRVGAYRESFSEEEIALMNAIMGPNLARYGYEVE